MKRLLAALVPALLLLLASCGGGGGSSSASSAASPRGTVRVGPTPSSATPSPQPARIPLEVVKRNGMALVLAPVTVGNRQYVFLVDTGASVTTVTTKAGKEMGATSAGESGTARGIGGSTKAQIVIVKGMRLGTTKLPPTRIAETDQIFPSAPNGSGLSQIAGLLGSDILSTFGQVDINYSTGKATLG